MKNTKNTDQTKQKADLKPWTMVFLTNLVVLIFCANAFLIYKNTLLEVNKGLNSDLPEAPLKVVKTPTIVPSPKVILPTQPVLTPTAIPTTALYPENGQELFNLHNQEISQLVKNILVGDVVYDMSRGKTENLFTSSNVYKINEDGSQISFNVESYHNPAGTVFEDGYEGFSWERNLEEEVNSLKNLSDGKQVADIYTTVGGKSKAEVNMVTLGGRKYAVYDTFFKPGMTWSRHFMTYDELNQQLIFFRISFVDYQNPESVSYSYIEDGSYFTNVVYPEIIQTFIQKFEEVLSSQ